MGVKGAPNSAEYREEETKRLQQLAPEVEESPSIATAKSFKGVRFLQLVITDHIIAAVDWSLKSVEAE